MQTLMFAIEILNGKVNEAPVFADWLSDQLQEDVKACGYMRTPNTLRIRTVLNVVEKHGSRKERRLMSKAFRKAMKQRHKHSKGATYAFLRKSWSLQEVSYNWFLPALRKELLALIVPNTNS